MLDRSLWITRFAIATAGLGCAAAAQDATVSATLLEPLTVQTITLAQNGNFPQSNTLPPGTIQNGSSVAVANGPGFSSDVTFGLTVDRRSIEFAATASGNAPMGSNASGGSLFATSSTNAAILLTITTTGPVSGQIEIEEDRSTGQNTGSEVDIGNDGTIEWNYVPFFNFPVGYPNPRVTTFPVTIDSSGTLDVLVRIPHSNITVFSSLTGVRSESTEMKVRFTPNTRCSATSFGIACDPNLALTVEPRIADGADIKLAGVTNGTAIALFGVIQQQTRIPLPPNCTLYTAIETSAPFMSIGSESLVPFSLAVSGPIQFIVQGAVLDPAAGTVLTSAPVTVNCN